MIKIMQDITHFNLLLKNFNHHADKLLQIDFDDYNSNLKEFVEFIRNEKFIYDYLTDISTDTTELGKINIGLLSPHWHEVYQYLKGVSEKEKIKRIYLLLQCMLGSNMNGLVDRNKIVSH